MPAPVNQVKRRNRFKKGHQTPEGSPHIQSRGEGSRPSSEGGRPLSPRPLSPRLLSPRPLSPRPVSPRPASPQSKRQQPEIRPEAEQPEEEGDRPWVRRPFDPVRESYKVVKSEYQVMERFIEEISNVFDAEPTEVMDRIKALPKSEDFTDLQARMDCLLKENIELRAKADEGNALRRENEALKNLVKEAEKAIKTARTERDMSKEIAQQVSKFLGSPGDVLNKARLFDHGLKQPATDSGVKIMRCMIDYSQKMEKTLKELRTLIQPTGGQPEHAGTPGVGPSTTPAPTASFVIPPPTRPNPLLQEPIPVLNTNDMANLRDWAEGGREALATPMTGTGVNPVTLSTPGSASQEHQRREEEWMKRRANEEESESSSSEEEGELPISLSLDEEEYEGYETPSDPSRPETPPYQVNRPVTRSMPRKKSSRSKRKAAQQKEQGGSSNKTYKRWKG